MAEVEVKKKLTLKQKLVLGFVIVVVGAACWIMATCFGVEVSEENKQKAIETGTALVEKAITTDKTAKEEAKPATEAKATTEAKAEVKQEVKKAEAKKTVKKVSAKKEAKEAKAEVKAAASKAEVKAEKK